MESTTQAVAVAAPNFLEVIVLFFQRGGPFMWVILAVWLFALAIALERFFKLAFKYDVNGPSFMNEIQRSILSQDLQGALRICAGSGALLAKVLGSGLKRANQSTAQMQNALDATALEVIPLAEARLSQLQLMANISTLLGLLGTIQGLIQSFESIASADPAQKQEVLSLGISTAMNTTFLGLIAAISIMVIHSYLHSKSEKIINEIDEFSVKLLDLLGTKKIKEERE